MSEDIGGPEGGERLPVFISSTFEDMDRDRDRDLIVHVVIPVVNDRLRQRAIGSRCIRSTCDGESRSNRASPTISGTDRFWQLALTRLLDVDRSSSG